MTWIPILVFALGMSLASPGGHLSGEVAGDDTRIEWGSHWVFVSLASCDHGEGCHGLAYQSSRPLTLTHIAYGGAGPAPAPRP